MSMCAKGEGASRRGNSGNELPPVPPYREDDSPWLDGNT